jgi:hypothetical protein
MMTFVLNYVIYVNDFSHVSHLDWNDYQNITYNILLPYHFLLRSLIYCILSVPTYTHFSISLFSSHLDLLKIHIF